MNGQTGTGELHLMEEFRTAVAWVGVTEVWVSNAGCPIGASFARGRYQNVSSNSNR